MELKVTNEELKEDVVVDTTLVNPESVAHSIEVMVGVFPACLSCVMVHEVAPVGPGPYTVGLYPALKLSGVYVTYNELSDDPLAGTPPTANVIRTVYEVLQSAVQLLQSVSVVH